MVMRVPTMVGPSVAPQGLPGVRESSIASPELLGAPSRELQAAGQATENLGTQLQAQRKQLYDQANAARVDDAVNAATEQALRLQHDKTDGYTTQTGYDALNRASGMPLADEYTGKLRQQVDKIGASLSNEDQRRMFGMRSNNIVTGFLGSAMAYETKQQQDYVLSVKDAAVATGKNAIALNPDPQNIADQTTRIRAAIEGGQDEKGNFIPGSAQMQGKSAVWAKERADEAVSDAHGNAVKSLMEQGNINMAMAYFKRYGGQMTAKDTLEVQGRLQHEYDTHVGTVVGNRVVDGAAPALQPADSVRLASLVMGAESAGKRYAPDGSLLQGPVTRSGERAQGEMQVMPATYKDPGYGIRPADLTGTPDQQANEIARVGKEKLNAMIVRYRGDVKKGLAAYNWGEGNVDRAIAEASSDAQSGAFRGGQPGPDYWMTKLPQETQNYVTGISAKYAAGAGAPPKPTLDDLHNQVRATLGPDASPHAVSTALETVTQRYTDADKAIKQRGEEVKAAAMKALVDNGGSYSQLPPNIRGDLKQFAPDQIDNVMNFGARVSKGDDTTNTAVYQRLSDPTVLRGLSDAQLYGLRGELSQEDFKHFSGERQKLLNPVGANGPGDLNSSAIKNVLDARLRELKIDPTPKDDGGNDAARVGSIRRFVDTQILAAQQQQGKKFTDAETGAFIDRLAATNPTLHGFFRGDYTAPLLSANTGDIPGATRDAITASLQKQGVSKPTDAQILNAFLHLSVRQQRK